MTTLSLKRGGPLGAVLEPFRFMRQHRALILSMAQRDLVVPYAGQMIGGVWAIAHPLFLVVLYTVVFSILTRNATYTYDYQVFIISGLVPWLSFIMLLAKGASEIVGNANLVKQVVFPLEVLPIKGVVTALMSLTIGVVFLVGYVLFTTGGLPWTYALIPLLYVIQILWMIGMAMIVSSLTVFFRDLKDFITLFATAGVYLLPIIFPKETDLGPFQIVVNANPFSAMIYCYRDVFLEGAITMPWAWGVFGGLGVVLFYGGFRLFRKLKPYFGNVL